MKQLSLESANLQDCVVGAQSEPIVLMSNGHAVAMIVGVDQDQADLGSSMKFWELIQQRRNENTVNRAALEAKLASQRSS